MPRLDTLGALVVVEGPNGIGKTSVRRLLARALTDDGNAVHEMSFPGDEPVGAAATVRRALCAATPAARSSTSPLALNALRAASHIDAIQHRVIPALVRGETVIVDRFWWSVAVDALIQGCSAGELESLVDAVRGAWGDVRPAAVVLLHRSAESEDRSEWATRVREYRRIAEQERPFYPVLDADKEKPLDTAFGRLKEILHRRSLRNGQIQFDIDLHVNAKPAPAAFPSTHILPLRPSVAYDTYWRFASERQEIFFRRLEGQLPPWTADPIFAKHKFTNAFRASDRTSQYLIRNVIYRADLPDTPQELFFRIMLFKFFNKIETWEALEADVGPLCYSTYDFRLYSDALNKIRAAGKSIYSGAYIMPPGGRDFGHDRKHENHLALLDRMIADDAPERLRDSTSMQRAFELLRSYPGIGDFLAYQYVIDINYSELTDFSESDFVVPGPGALDGIRKCFVDCGGLNEPEVIKFMADRQEREFERLGLEFRTLWGRRLQLIDCQNLFCEVDKFSRVRHPEISGITGRSRIKQRFVPKALLANPWYPPKWNLNESIEHWTRSRNGQGVKAKTGNRHQVRAMDLNEYQSSAHQTSKKSTSTDSDVIIPILGLAGEVGELLNEYKKRIRDGEAHTRFSARVTEELGDILWYVAETATKFNLQLSDIAAENLEKTRARWSGIAATDPLPDPKPRMFDDLFPDGQRFPRQLTADFRQWHENGVVRTRVFVAGLQMGQDLTDNAYVPDGYRFHDVFHLACTAVLGWSPVTRRNLGLKRKSDPKVDEVEDGGRAIVTEEGISALVFAYAEDHNALEGVHSVDYDLLKAIRIMTARFEVAVCTTGEWERAILLGYKVWKQVAGNQGGKVELDLDTRTIRYLGMV
jgi:thymidylate kinase/NTP pyrophosphatase (non-canonical NTP hydrolase)